MRSICSGDRVTAPFPRTADGRLFEFTTVTGPRTFCSTHQPGSVNHELESCTLMYACEGLIVTGTGTFVFVTAARAAVSPSAILIFPLSQFRRMVGVCHVPTNSGLSPRFLGCRYRHTVPAARHCSNILLRPQGHGYPKSKSLAPSPQTLDSGFCRSIRRLQTIRSIQRRARKRRARMEFPRTRLSFVK